ncbi:MAG: sigma-70 family RNA polymerase sigma factor [Myxococcota bacterium]
MAPPDVDEKALIDRLRAGDDAAYDELVRAYGARLLAVARRFLRTEDDARDAVQDAFLAAFRSIDRFEGNARVSTWLHRIVVNASLMKLRTRRRKPEQSIEELLPGFLENGHLEAPASPWRQVELDGAEREELRDLLHRCIDELPEGYRNVLMLRDIEELDTEETAEIMGLSTGAVKTRLHRARQALRELLAPHLEGASS